MATIGQAHADDWYAPTGSPAKEGVVVAERKSDRQSIVMKNCLYRRRNFMGNIIPAAGDR